jgi:hypothetical protein
MIAGEETMAQVRAIAMLVKASLHYALEMNPSLSNGGQELMAKFNEISAQK